MIRRKNKQNKSGMVRCYAFRGDTKIMNVDSLAKKNENKRDETTHEIPFIIFRLITHIITFISSLIYYSFATDVIKSLDKQIGYFRREAKTSQ